MNSDHYAQHIIQKYKLAVAIGVLQTKPETKSLDQYLADLRSKMNDDIMDEVTVCSDDFDVDINDNDFHDNNEDSNDASQVSDTILKDFIDAPEIQVENMDVFSDVLDLEHETQTQIININNTQSTFCETQPPADAYLARESLTDIDRTFCDCIAHINQNEIIHIDKTCDSIAQIYENKRKCANVGQFHTIEFVDDKGYEKVDVINNNTVDIDLTICESLPEVTLKDANKMTNISVKRNVEDTYCDRKVKTNKNNTIFSDQTFCESSKLTVFNKHKENAQKSVSNTQTKKETARQNLNAFDSQETELYTFHTLEDTHVSQSQNQHFGVADKYIKGTNKNTDRENKRKNEVDILSGHVISTEFNNNLKNVNFTKNVKNKTNSMQKENVNFDRNTQITIAKPRHPKGKGNLAKKIKKNLNKEHVQMQRDDVNYSNITQNTDVNHSLSIADKKVKDNAKNLEFQCYSKNDNLASEVTRKLENNDVEMKIDSDKEVNHKQNVELNKNLNVINSLREVNKNTVIENVKTPGVTNNFDNNTRTATFISGNFTENVNSLQDTQTFSSTYNNIEKLISNGHENITKEHEISRSNLNNQNMTLQIHNLSQNQFIIKVPNTLQKIPKVNLQNTKDMSMQVLNFRQNEKQNVTDGYELNGSVNNNRQVIKNDNNYENMTMQVLNFSQNDYNNISEMNKTTNYVQEISKGNINNDNTTMQVLNFSQNSLSDDHKINSVKETSKTGNDEDMTVVTNFIENTSTSKIDSAKEIGKTGNNENMTIVTNFSEISTGNIDTIESDSSTEELESELVPFKVMEELNRVKSYLNRRVERRLSFESSLDSGYRSDSQGRSKSALQLSGNWVGQSAYCLYEHITRCPMVSTTQEIVGEIAQVLGQLIDRLHEDECYPTFLEELLEHVDTLIQSIFTEEDMLLEKDEKIQRLFLLNKSTHIQIYTIEKLTDILEVTQTHLTDKEDIYELTDIEQLENLSYIFHILEVIIKKHLKYKKNASSQSQTQETEKSARKSSITDIWRKKWNPNFKETKLESGYEKKCVLKKCCQVLNKIVVGGMDGYSLVAFSALQCFNLLQN